ncbi:MAG: hypothetical protein KDC98_17035 [Planctomycetes bacterium]|nr:hypothetical protein [Planctomycetota bacterium]
MRTLPPLLLACATLAQSTERVSLGAGGAQITTGVAWPAMSGNGRYIAFTTPAANVVPGDTNNRNDVFVRDLATGVIRRASLTAAGVEPNDHCFDPQLSDDGRFVAFSSWATNLATSDVNGAATDVFVKDMQTGALEHVSVDDNGVGGNGISVYHAISGDGRFVTFYSYATNLIANDSNGNAADTFLYDRVARHIECLTVDPVTGATLGGGTAALSYDGRIVAFETVPQVVAQTGGSGTIAVLDRQTGTVRAANVNGSGQIRHGTGPIVSADGSCVLFHTAFALDPADGDYATDAYRFDLATGQVALVTPSPAGTTSAYSASASAISASGRYVLFSSHEVYDPIDTNDEYDLFVFDIGTGAVEMISVGDRGQIGDGRAGGGAIAANGARCVFLSLAANLVSGDTNGTADIFYRDRCSPSAWRNYGQGLAGSGGLVPGFALLGEPALGTTPLLLAANHTGAPTLAAMVLGAQPASVPTPVLGTLLVQPAATAGVLVPTPALTLPIRIPTTFELCGSRLYLQTLLLDGGAPLGVSFTRGLELVIGG